MTRQFKVFLNFALNKDESKQVKRAFGSKASAEPRDYCEKTGGHFVLIRGKIDPVTIQNTIEKLFLETRPDAIITVLELNIVK